MPLEIERKFLVTGNFKEYSLAHEEIIQGYLSSAPERSVRIRVKEKQAYITIKGISNDTGTSRYEWEKEITVPEAMELMKLCEPGVIDKVRYYVDYHDHTFEIDEFRGENKGLIIAELELSDKAEIFDKPDWLGKEVTGDKRFYNSFLSKNPYINWKEYD